MASAKGQRGYLSRLAEPMPAGGAELKPTRPVGAPDWRALVPEVQDETVPRPATAQHHARKSRSLMSSLDAVPLPTPSIEAGRRIEASTVTTPEPQPHDASAKASHREVERPTTAAHAAVPQTREAVQPDAAVVSTRQVERPQQFRETHSVAPQSTTQAAVQEHPLTTAQSQQPSTPHVATPLNENKPQPTPAAVHAAESKSAESKPNPAPSSNRKAVSDPAPHPPSSTSQPQLSFKPQAKPAQADPLLLPLTSRFKPATEANPRERTPARVHIGKLEIRMTAPPQTVAAPAAAKPAQMQRLTPPAAATAPQPLSRELAWTYGLVQG